MPGKQQRCCQGPRSAQSSPSKRQADVQDEFGANDLSDAAYNSIDLVQATQKANVLGLLRCAAARLGWGGGGPGL